MKIYNGRSVSTFQVETVSWEVAVMLDILQVRAHKKLDLGRMMATCKVAKLLYRCNHQDVLEQESRKSP